MLIVSVRKDFNHPDLLNIGGDLYKDVDLNINDEKSRVITQNEFIEKISVKKVLILVHGHNNELDEVFEAYSVIEMKVKELLESQYDIIIGYTWPSGDNGLDWWASKDRADEVGERFKHFLENIHDNIKALDIMSHSLGARVVLNALKQSEYIPLIRNYFCTAPAVDNEVLEKGEEFNKSIFRAESIYIFHSKNDGVLASLYRLAEFDNALGLYGPENKDFIIENTTNIFVANCKKIVDGHSNYKWSDDVYRYISKSFIGKPEKLKIL